MRRLLPWLALLMFLGTATPAVADDAATKDKELAALKAEAERLRARVAELEQALVAATTALELAQKELATLRSGKPADPIPTSGGLHQGQETSREQLKYLHYLYKSYKPAAGQPQWPALDGKNFVLFLVAVGQLEHNNEGPLKMLFSPADKALSFPGTKPYGALTPDSLAKQRFPGLTSYAGRRNAALPITAQSPPATTALFADLSFGDGALVAFLDGKVKYLRRADLGLAPADPLVAGPASKSPLLQTLSAE
jgi:hypothetical protein